jgi:hypothetical protein
VDTTPRVVLTNGEEVNVRLAHPDAFKDAVIRAWEIFLAELKGWTVDGDNLAPQVIINNCILEASILPCRGLDGLVRVVLVVELEIEQGKYPYERFYLLALPSKKGDNTWGLHSKVVRILIFDEGDERKSEGVPETLPTLFKL